MLFVDGENFTRRAQQVAKDETVSLAEGPFHLRDTFVWVPDFLGTRAMQAADGMTVPRNRTLSGRTITRASSAMKKRLDALETIYFR